MPMSGDGDELIARIAALEPARGTAPLSKRSIRSLIRAATVTPHEARTWTWPRYRLASLGTLIGSSALVIAAIVGLDSVGSSLPTVLASAARTARHPLVPPSSPSVAGYSFAAFAITSSTAGAMGCPVILADHADANVLASGPSHATAYRVESRLSPSRALLALAPAFGLGTSSVKWFSMRAHARGGGWARWPVPRSPRTRRRGSRGGRTSDAASRPHDSFRARGGTGRTSCQHGLHA